LTSIEICAGAGGQALGLEQAGFRHVALVEIDHWACETLRANRPEWAEIVYEGDVRGFVRKLDPSEHAGVTLVAGGVPCPPFSVAGKRLGRDDERDLFPAALSLVEKVQPQAVMLENVRGLLDTEFADYRAQIKTRLDSLGYWSDWKLLNASDYGVPQLRPRAILVALRKGLECQFVWPAVLESKPRSVGEVLHSEMASRGWEGAGEWAALANDIAPTLVGGSHKHGGPDLGPTRARKAWAKLGVNGKLLAAEPPGPGFEGMPYLTVQMAALIQGFPEDWRIQGKKTAAYRQVGNAFPPPVARVVGLKIREAIERAECGTNPAREHLVTLYHDDGSFFYRHTATGLTRRLIFGSPKETQFDLLFVLVNRQPSDAPLFADVPDRAVLYFHRWDGGHEVGYSVDVFTPQGAPLDNSEQ
jgi:DNA (cytosine-5)-methyltransferase 1